MLSGARNYRAGKKGGRTALKQEKTLDRKIDCYAIDFTAGEETELLDEIDAMESHDRWIHDVRANELSTVEVAYPMDAMKVAEEYDLDYELTLDTAQDGNMKMILRQDMDRELAAERLVPPAFASCLRGSARGGLYDNAAKLNGPALGRMEIPILCETLNNGTEVNPGKLLLLERYGKVSAIHSDAAGGYCIMPISELLKVTKELISKQFGRMKFLGGSNSHSYTYAKWALPDAQGALVKAYEDALKGAVARHFAVDLMPAVKFFTSDTKKSSARLIPIFITSRGAEIQLVEGVAVKHERVAAGSTAPQGVEKYAEQTANIYAMFTDATEAAKELSRIEIWNPANCVVSLCRKYNIGKKYGEAARGEIERLSAGSPCVSALDVYMAMNNIVVEAKMMGARASVLMMLQENVAKVLRADWADHDVGGVVAWKD